MRTVLFCLLLLFSLSAVASVQERPDDAFYPLLQEAVAESGSFGDRFEAEVWLLDMSQRLEDKIPVAERRLKLLKIIHQEARRVDVPPELVLAVIQVESDFDRFAISSAGARGYMQIMPFWLREIGRPADNLFTTRINIRVGCMILRYYLDKERGDLARALARYNGSLGRAFYPRRVFEALRTRWYRQ